MKLHRGGAEITVHQAESTRPAGITLTSPGLMLQEYAGLEQHQHVAMTALATLSLFKDDNQAENIHVNSTPKTEICPTIKTIPVLTTQLY